MSTAQSNTHSASSTTRGGKISRGGNSRNQSMADEPAEFKALRNKYPSQVKMLKELFPIWSEADLLSAISEADGNLETAVIHITEGFATQWGEVKSRKEKRQAPKSQHEEGKSSEIGSHVPRPASFRGGVRGGAARGGRGGHSHAASARAKTQSASKEAGAASTVDSVDGWEIETSPVQNNTSASLDAKKSGQNTASKESKSVSASAAAGTTPAKPAPMSWASIAKRGVRQPSPEPSEPSQPSEAPKEASEAAQPKTPKSSAKEASKRTRRPKDEIKNVKKEAPLAEAEDVPTADDASAVDAVVIDEEMVMIATPVETEEKTSDAAAAPLTSDATEQSQEATLETQKIPAEDATAASAPANKKPASTARRLNQDAAVVMPTGNATLERIGMQFGSLSIGGVEFGSLNAGTTEKSPLEPVAEPKELPAAVPVAAHTPAAPSAEIVQAPAAAPAQAAAAPVSTSENVPVAAQGPLTAYLQQQQQQQQQQQHQPPQPQPQQQQQQQQQAVQPNQPTQQPSYSNASANAISQMPLPNDYGAAALYGADAAQRNMMGFYDNYGYGQFAANKDNSSAPAASSAELQQPVTTANSQAVGVNGVSNIGQSGIFPQQIPQPFGMNHGMPYYNPYYYNMMQPGSQFPNPAFGNNPALAAAYGQPFMKQGMYPMYPGSNPQGIQSTGSQPQQQQQQQQQQAMQQQASQQASVAQHASAQQGQAGVQHQQAQQPQQPQGQAGAQQAGVKGPGMGAQNSASSYGNISSQKSAGNPYAHYSGNIGGFNVYEQDPAALSNSPQQFGLSGIPGIFSATKAGGKDHGNPKTVPQTGAAPVIGGTTYYSTPQQLGGYSSQINNSHPQGFGHQQQPYYNPYAPSYAQSQTPHIYQQQQQPHQQQQQPPQTGHQQSTKQYWEKQ